jgi:hypothetical protein
MTSIPREEQIPGIQSTNLTCTVEPLRELWDQAAASTKKKKPRENWREEGVSYSIFFIVIIGGSLRDG